MAGGDELLQLETDLGRLAEPTLDLGGTPSAAPPPASRRYAVLERLGAGGMGTVYAAYDARLDRKVALKVLHREESARARARFAKEAQALARLHHPNVVAVFDAGEVGERPYVAMELVEGTTLRSWLGASPRSWREVVRVFLAAGEGLAAAHAAGLVHRDVKPDNILVGHDGQVRVADFGLARAAEATDEPEGDTAGTPRYMAPEQQGGRADAASDQFAFAVSLREALAGIPAPAFLGRVVERGTRAEPAARYPDLRALLADLARDPSRRRRRLGAAGAVVVAAAGIAALSVRLATSDPCAGAGDLGGVWDDEVRERVRAGFRASGRPEAAFDRVAAGLDAYRKAWDEMRGESCRATAVRHTQSEALLDRRTRCLDQRRTEVASLLRLLVAPDGPTVDRAAAAVARLEPVAGCADADALLAASPPWRSPRMPGIEARLAAVRALALLQRYAEALGPALALVIEAPTIEDPPTRARAALALAPLLLGRPAPRALLLLDEGFLLRGLSHAATARLHTLEAEHWPHLIWRRTSLGNLEGALALELPARLAVDRAGGEPRLEVLLLATLSETQHEAAHPTEALALAREALELAERAFGPDDLLVNRALFTLAQALEAQGQYDEAQRVVDRLRRFAERSGELDPSVAPESLHLQGRLARAQHRAEEARRAFTESMTLFERLEGPDSPNAASALNDLIALDTADERYEGAIAGYQKIVARLERSGSAPDLGIWLGNLGIAEAQLGDLVAARAHIERAQAIFATQIPDDHLNHGLMLLFLAYIEIREGRLEEAEASARRGMAIVDKALGPDNVVTSDGLEILGSAIVARGRAAEAIPLLARTLALREQNGGPDSLAVANALHHYGDALLRAGRTEEALAILERGEALRARKGHDLLERGGLRLALAQARWATGRREAAREAAHGALADYRAARFGASGAARAERWIEEHR